MSLNFSTDFLLKFYIILFFIKFTKNPLQIVKKIVLYNVIWCVLSKDTNFHFNGGEK